MISSRARFVGGKADGRTYAFPGFPPTWFKVAVAPPITWRVWEQAPMDEALAIEHQNYRRHHLPGNTKTFFIFAPEDWTTDEVYEHLLYGNGVILSEH